MRGWTQTRSVFNSWSRTMWTARSLMQSVTSRWTLTFTRSVFNSWSRTMWTARSLMHSVASVSDRCVLSQVGITLFTVTHRKSLWKHHEVRRPSCFFILALIFCFTSSDPLDLFLNIVTVSVNLTLLFGVALLAPNRVYIYMLHLNTMSHMS